jgi:hypothetical protein
MVSRFSVLKHDQWFVFCCGQNKVEHQRPNAEWQALAAGSCDIRTTFQIFEATLFALLSFLFYVLILRSLYHVVLP